MTECKHSNIQSQGAASSQEDLWNYYGVVNDDPDDTKTASLVARVRSGFNTDGLAEADDPERALLDAIHEGKVVPLQGRPRPKPKTRFRFLSSKAIEAMPDPMWNIDGVLPENALAVLYGREGSWKTFLALDWAHCIATGHHWHAHETQRGEVLYVCAEGVSGMKHRLHAWRKAHGVEVSDVAGLRMIPSTVNMMDRDEVRKLVEDTRASRMHPLLIVIDTLARCFVGGDENSTKDMNTFVRNCDRLREAFPGSTVLVLHHSGKDVARGDRGSTALRGAADVRVQIYQADKSEKRIVKCWKQKDAEEFRTMAFKSRKVAQSLVLQSTSVDAADREQEVLAALDPEGSTHTQWFEASGLKGKQTFENVRKKLERDGCVRKLDQRYFPHEDETEGETAETVGNAAV